MITNTKNIQVTKTARYYTNELNPAEVKNIWFLFHGYGQLAGNFIKKFEQLDNGKNYLIAPEALSRFYLDNGFGKIGASWMTREDRDNEIDNYVNYLSELYNLLRNKIVRKDLKLNVFSFSQGTSTACRWLQRSGIKADNLILWGGFLPNDFELDNAAKSFGKLLLVTGTEDQFFPPAALEEGKKILDSHSINYSVHLYEGIHEMRDEVVKEVLTQF